MAYIDDEGGEVFYYTEPGSNELYYYTSVLNKYDIMGIRERMDRRMSCINNFKVRRMSKKKRT